jgi:hypothetical protein
MAERFMQRVGPDGKVSLGELDAYVRESFTDPLRGAYTRGSEQELATRLMDVRRDITGLLYSAIDPSAKQLQVTTQQAIGKRQAVENVFGLGTEAKPSAAGAEKIRGIRGNTGQAQQNRAILEAYDAEYGTNFLQRARELSMQREWAGSAAEDAVTIDNILVLRQRRPGAIKGASRFLAKQGARVTNRYAGPVAAGATAAFEGAILSGRRKRLVEESP